VDGIEQDNIADAAAHFEAIQFWHWPSTPTVRRWGSTILSVHHPTDDLPPLHLLRSGDPRNQMGQRLRQR
jgi:hypothetical protein